jgi:hypothetical protein
MSIRPPDLSKLQRSAEANLDAIGQEILAEKAASLGNAGRKVGAAMEELTRRGEDARSDPALVKAAAEAVYAYFVQRELCGMRRHDDVIRHHSIPKEVLARLGAK